MFFCCDCLPKVGQSFEFFDKMSDRQAQMDKRLKDIESKLNSLSEGVADCNDDEEMSSQDTKNTAVASRPAGLLYRIDTGGITSAVALAISEEKEREKRKLNVILHNAAEPTSDEGNYRKKEDIEPVFNIFQKSLNVAVRVVNAVRLGKRSDKPRLLKVSADSELSKASILQNYSKLRGKDVPQSLSKVFITPDMTIKERENNRALRSQLADLSNDDKKYKI